MTFRQQAWGRRTRSRWFPRASAASRVPSGFLAALGRSWCPAARETTRLAGGAAGGRGAVRPPPAAGGPGPRLWAVRAEGVSRRRRRVINIPAPTSGVGSYIQPAPASCHIYKNRLVILESVHFQRSCGAATLWRSTRRLPDFRRPASRLSECASEEEEVGREGGIASCPRQPRRCRVAAAAEEDATDQPAAEEDETEQPSRPRQPRRCRPASAAAAAQLSQEAGARS